MALPLPVVPKSPDAELLFRYLNDLNKYISSKDKQPVLMPRVYYADRAKLRGEIGLLVMMPDHPSGSSIIMWDGVSFQRFTTAGVM